MFAEEKFISHLKYNIEIPDDARILLAVSGGVDSMCMLELFARHLKKDKIAVAHVNFQLRGTESDGDEKLVESACKAKGIKFHSTSFDTRLKSVEMKTGIQETARNLRYQWFNELLSAEHYDYLATAHHAEDHVETVLFNIIRGSGLAGLKGIQVKKEKIIRPLLCLNKNEIHSFASNHSIVYREDSSNTDDHYSRNYIRHHLIPAMHQINHGFINHFRDLSDHAASAERMIEDVMQQFIKLHCLKKDDLFEIPISSLYELSSPEFCLFYLLKPYGFNPAQVNEIYAALTSQSGKKFLSDTHCLMKDRLSLLIFSIPSPLSPVTVTVPGMVTWHHTHIHFELVTIKQNEDLSFKNCKALFADPSALNLKNLHIRQWSTGDRFIPLGMSHSKKISDYLIDKKVNAYEKILASILLSDDIPVAVLPYQIDNRFRLTKEGGSALKISFVHGS